jgi:hypothetical protein
VTHFQAMVLYSALIAVALACLTTRTLNERVRYAAITFAMFLIAGIGIAWLMYPLSR